MRTCYTKQIARSLFPVALTYGEALVTAKRFIEAEEMLQRLEDSEEQTEIMAVLAQEIVRLKIRIKQAWKVEPR